MFRHVVMLKWVERATEADKQAVRDGLGTLPDVISEIRRYRFGDDTGLNPDNFDFVVVGDFEDEAGYLVYRDHPAHQKVVQEAILPILAGRAAVQHRWATALPSDLPA